METKKNQIHITKPLISIGMPVYNGGKYIRQSIESLITQTFNDYELVISDNSSSDETESICREYADKDSRIRYIRQSRNLGASANYQVVLNESIGEYFMWAASDDYWGQEHLSRCINLLNVNSQAIGASTGCKLGNHTGKMTGDGEIISKYSIIRKIIFLLNPGPNARFYSLYRMKYLKKIDFNKYNYFAGDWVYMLDVIEHGSIIKDKNYVGFYKRVHHESGSSIKNIISKLKSDGDPIIFPLKRLLIHVSRTEKLSRLLILSLFIMYQNIICLKWFVTDYLAEKNKILGV